MTEMRRLLNLMDGVATEPVTESTLAEGRYNGTALLYHSSGPSNALLIICSGNIEPRTTATIDGHKVKGVSLTRSRSFAIAYNSVIFGFDEQKVRRSYRGKLVPYVDSSLDVIPEVNADWRREAEEFLTAPLPLTSLVAVWISSSPPYALSRTERHVIETHPLYAGIL